jgi:hypothetical protein
VSVGIITGAISHSQSISQSDRKVNHAEKRRNAASVLARFKVNSCNSEADILRTKLQKAASCDLAGLRLVFQWRNGRP